MYLAYVLGPTNAWSCFDTFETLLEGLSVIQDGFTCLHLC